MRVISLTTFIRSRLFFHAVSSQRMRAVAYETENYRYGARRLSLDGRNMTRYTQQAD